MKDSDKNNNGLIIDKLYRENSERIYKFIISRIGNEEEAENLSQDVWVKLMTVKELKEETAVPYIFRIATNLINDYFRGLYARMGAEEDLKDQFSDVESVTPEHRMAAAQLAEFELNRVECLPQQRRIIYIMSRFEDKSVADISAELALSHRTVENHLRLGRHDVRNYMTAIA